MPGKRPENDLEDAVAYEQGLDLAVMEKRLPLEDINADDEWDAGDRGCGEIIILLRRRMQGLDPGAVLKLTARDQGAHADLPAWCRMTGRRLLRAEHPEYWIQQ